MRFTVLLVNYKSAELVQRCLISLVGLPVTDIWILDNDSGSFDRDLLEGLAAKDDRITLIESDHNIGFGAGINRLANVSGGAPDDVIWILNPDTELVEGDVQEMLTALAAEEFDVISPLLVTGRSDDRTVWFGGGGIDISRGLCWHDRYGDHFAGVESGLQSTEFMTGAAPLMTRRTWDLIGGFHEGLFLYWEDVEFSLRATQLGLKLGVAQAVAVWHLEGGSGEGSAGHSETYYYYNAANRIRVCAAMGGRVQILLGLGLRETALWVLRPLFKEQTGRTRKSFAALRGTYAGFRKSQRGLGSRNSEGTGSDIAPRLPLSQRKARRT
ncbi:glycosyltransferase [Cryobacterium sp. W22_MBD10_FK3]|uniref:glycosyltransferase n=1 Tax=Cryobacterium sp. W22_MBD10_FK3 TaxID=3240273 RepID=UPI003F908C4F